MRLSLAGVLGFTLLLPAAALAQGSAGPDVFNGADSKRNVFRAGAGADRLNGGARGDLLCGEAGSDQIGGGGSDRLSGGAGRDTISGGVGNDRLSGGAGNDTLSGGPGRDRYSGGAGNDQVSAANGRSEHVDCGSGRGDIARVDGDDRVSGCEIVFRS